MTPPSVMVNHPTLPPPRWLVDELVLLEFPHWNFQGEISIARLVINTHLVPDTVRFFHFAFRLGFPFEQIVPINEFDWDDRISCEANNTSAYNRRCVEVSTGPKRLSWHALALALDANPKQNPCWDVSEKGLPPFEMIPRNGSYDLNKPGTFNRQHPLIRFLVVKKKWTYGAYWHSPQDNHHLQRIPDKYLEFDRAL